jgi:L-cysteine:1D-myo-inositol 2-amino-2-deoxy-alpha-D-glucopyranoside ligase
MYVCGITPYDATHLGHAFTYSTFDLLHRVWLDEGRSVQYVQNVTDIDDPLLERAVATGEDWRELAARETALFGADMESLRVLPPSHYVGAVESMDLVVAMVRVLDGHGAVYSLEGDLYFSVASDPRFGSVAGLELDSMVTLAEQRGGDPHRPGKRHPLDPVLWQLERPAEPAWDTVLGHGRPGWHIECTAIALDRLGFAFDVQGGGRDLTFPHHEMCASIGQVVAADWPFARRYLHVGMVGLDGEKMSKSRGNLVLVSRLRAADVPPAAVRLALHAHHYRQDWEWTPTDLERAQARLDAWRQAVAAPTGPPTTTVLDEVRQALADDLDAPTALALVDRWVERCRRGEGRDEHAPAEVAALVDSLLGVELSSA